MPQVESQQCRRPLGREALIVPAHGGWTVVLPTEKCVGMKDNLTGRVKYHIRSGHNCEVISCFKSGRVDIEENLTGRRTRRASCRMRPGHIGEIEIQALWPFR